jgi:hypothetical protein
MQAEYMFTRVVVGRTEITVVQNRDPDAGENPFDIVVDGKVRSTVELGKYYPPSIGVYDDERMAVWAGNQAVFGTEQPDRWNAFDFGEPVHAVYRLSYGWCVVTELTVLTINENGQVVCEFGYHEIIISSRWINESLVIEDFEANVLAVKIDDTLMITVTDFPASLNLA